MFKLLTRNVLILFLFLFYQANAQDRTLTLSESLVNNLVKLPHINNKILQYADLKNKPIIVTFFASWCLPCHEEFKQLNKLAAVSSSSSLTIVAVNVFEDWFGVNESRLKRFMETYSPKFFVVKGNNYIKKMFNNVNRIPTLYLFDRDGVAQNKFIHLSNSNKTHVKENELREILLKMESG